MVELTEHTLVDRLGKLIKITLVGSVVCTAIPTEQTAEYIVIAHNVKMTETVCSTPYTSKQAQYELYRIVTTVRTLKRQP